MKWNEATPSLLKTIRFNSLNICLWGMLFSDSFIPLSRAMGNILPELQTPDLDIIFLLQLQHYEMPSKSSILISTQNSLVYSVIHIFPWSLLLAASCSLDSKMLILVSNSLHNSSSLPHLYRQQLCLALFTPFLSLLGYTVYTQINFLRRLRCKDLYSRNQTPMQCLHWANL